VGTAGMTFGDWLAPPRKRTPRVVFAGMQTPMADGLDTLPARPGDDLFIAATDLIAAGSPTALISRWRMGGKVGTDLVAEFLREVTAAGPDGAAAAASTCWQRAVDIVTAEQPDPEQEPRLKASPKAVLPDARHPLFWAGPMLIDCGPGTYPDGPPPAAAR